MIPEFIISTMSTCHRKNCSTQLCNVARKLFKLPESGYNTTGCYVIQACYENFTGKKTTWKAHDSDVNNIIELKNGQIVSCSEDETVKIWDIKTGECKMTFKLDRRQSNSVTNIIELKDGRLLMCTIQEIMKILT